MIETRFKKTEVGMIPEDWQISTLKDICIKITDGSHESPKESAIGYYMPSVKDMTATGFDFSECKKISEVDYYRLVKNGCKPKVNDVLIAKDGSILKYSISIKKDMPIVILSSIAIIRPNNQIVDSDYLSTIFKQKEFINEVSENYKTGTGVPRIVLKNFAKIKISYPTKVSEQTRIASTLSNIDALISELDKLIEKKRAIKQGAMQELLTGKKRLKGFTEPWVEKKIAQLGKLVNNSINPQFTPSEKFNEYSMPAYDEGKKPVEVYGSDMHSSRFLITGEILLFNKLNVRQKRIWYIKKCLPNAVCSMEFLPFKSETSTMRYLRQFLSYDKVVEDFKEMSKGTSNSQQRIRPSDFLEYVTLLPSSIKEQEAIADILNNMDAELTELESKRAKYKALKQGMMQQLLTGKIRLI